MLRYSIYSRLTSGRQCVCAYMDFFFFFQFGVAFSQYKLICVLRLYSLSLRWLSTLLDKLHRNLHEKFIIVLQTICVRMLNVSNTSFTVLSVSLFCAIYVDPHCDGHRLLKYVGVRRKTPIVSYVLIMYCVNCITFFKDLPLVSVMGNMNPFHSSV